MSLLLRLSFNLLLFIALSTNAQPFNHNQPFDAASANKTLAQFSTLSTEKASVSQLKNSLSTLSKLIESAQSCVTNTNSQLEDLNKNLTAIITPTQSKKLSPEQKYLGNKKDLLSSQLSDCQLFLLRANETTTALNTRLKKLVKSELFYSEASLIDSVRETPKDFREFSHNLNFALMGQLSGISQLDWRKTLGLIFLLVIGFISGLKLRHSLQKNTKTEPTTTITQQLKKNTSDILKKTIPWLIPTTLFSLFFTATTPSLQAIPGLALIGYALIAYLIFMMAVNFLFHPAPSKFRMSELPESVAFLLVRRLRVLAWICLITYSIVIIFRMQHIPDNLLIIFRTLVITAIVLTLISITWLMRTLPKINFHYSKIRILSIFILIILLVSALIAQWLGYFLLANYILHGVIITILAIFITRLILKLIDLSLENLSEAPYQWQQTLKSKLGFREQEHFNEALWLRMLLYLLTWCFLFLWLLKTWGLAPSNFQILTHKLIYGINIGKLPIVPSRIILGLLFSIIISIATRWFRTHLVKNINLRLDQGNREALASIATYIGFVVAILVALLIAGVNFSGLAIVAGALSVGIGFGLQNIVSNFVAGIILLVERPIKPGDRIIVDDMEGYVRRISIRSTHIITLQQADVIVPNSDLIAKQVTNFMLYDTNYMIIIAVGIEYGSDTELAKSLLLELARHHPHVIKNITGKEPQVYFKNFGDNSLDFELWCLIANVNSKGSVASDLHFKIEESFRKHNINIAFPQREITIRNWPIDKDPRGDLPAEKI